MGFRDDLKDSVGAAVCDILGAGGDAARWGAGLGVSAGGPRGAFAGVNLLATAGAAEGYFCDRPPGALPSPGFVGGQCEVAYRVLYSYTSDSPFSNPNGSGEKIVDGPVGGIRASLPPGGGMEIILTANGQDVLVTSRGGATANWPNLQAQIDGVERVDGQADNCGNGVGNPDPLTPEERERQITIGDVNAQFALGNGVLNVNGDVTAPIRINSPNFEFTGEVNLNRGDISFNFGGADPDAPCTPRLPEPEQDPPPEPEQDPPDDDEPPPEDEEDSSNIIGVIVTTQLIDASAGITRVHQGENPDIIVPKLGYVSFRIKVGSAYAWTEDIPIKVERQYVHVPGGVSAIAVAGTPRIGITWVLTPVKGVQPSIEFE